MEPEPKTTELLRSLEEQLLQPEVRKSSAKLGELLADEFVEFGSSGRTYNKSEVIESLRQEYRGDSVQRTIVDFTVLWLAPNTVLATYRLVVWHDRAEREQHIAKLDLEIERRQLADGFSSGHADRTMISANTTPALLDDGWPVAAPEQEGLGSAILSGIGRRFSAWPEGLWSPTTVGIQTPLPQGQGENALPRFG